MTKIVILRIIVTFESCLDIKSFISPELVYNLLEIVYRFQLYLILVSFYTSSGADSLLLVPEEGDGRGSSNARPLPLHLHLQHAQLGCSRPQHAQQDVYR